MHAGFCLPSGRTAARLPLWCAMLFVACVPAGGFAPAATLLQQASRCVFRRGTAIPLASRSVALRETVPASGRRAFGATRRVDGWETPACAVRMVAGTADAADAAGAASTVIQVGGRDVTLDEKSLREAFEKSDDDSQVTVRIEVDEIVAKAKERLDTFLSRRITILSRSSLNRIIKAECVTINGKTPKPSAKLKVGDSILVSLPPPPGNDVDGEDIPLSILFEDDQIVVINKQSDFVVHPAPSCPSGTLVNALAYHFAHRSSGNLSSVGADNARPGIVHRLDRNTTGAMVVAKTEGAHWHLYEQFARRSPDKRYLALVHGEVAQDAGLIDLPLGRHPYDPIKFAVVEGGKASQTYFKVREVYEGFTLVELKLLTGRTHQIRVHLAHLRHPIVGDVVYGGRQLKTGDVVRQHILAGKSMPLSQMLIARQALHSATLSIHHPTHETRLNSTAPAPFDLANTIWLLRQHRLVRLVDPIKVDATVNLDAVILAQQD